MVLFDNVKLNQKVEVRWRGCIEPGTIKYKGSMNGVRGEWVGVALNRRVGLHDGMVKGRRYFLCDDKHGIFTLASQIRFVQLKRCLYNSYRTVEPDTFEEDLFGDREKPTEDRSGWVVQGYADKFQSPRFRDQPATARSTATSRTHSIGGKIPPATWLRPQSARSDYTHKRRPIHYEYENDSDDFIRSSSIPLVHMPHTALKRQVTRGWEKAPMVRYWSVHTGRDAIKYSQWNDISA